jgi:hypothetical protein
VRGGGGGRRLAPAARAFGEWASCTDSPGLRRGATIFCPLRGLVGFGARPARRSAPAAGRALGSCGGARRKAEAGPSAPLKDASLRKTPRGCAGRCRGVGARCARRSAPGGRRLAPAARAFGEWASCTDSLGLRRGATIFCPLRGLVGFGARPARRSAPAAGRPVDFVRWNKTKSRSRSFSSAERRFAQDDTARGRGVAGSARDPQAGARRGMGLRRCAGAKAPSLSWTHLRHG